LFLPAPQSLSQFHNIVGPIRVGILQSLWCCSIFYFYK